VKNKTVEQPRKRRAKIIFGVRPLSTLAIIGRELYSAPMLVDHDPAAEVHPWQRC
jgi:hypothetical protein